ncbi:MAG: glycosyltransferase family 39 protein [Bryobacteraceae bacterium]
MESFRATKLPLAALPETSRSKRGLAAILLAAFVMRLAWRIHLGNDDFWVNGYSFFYDLAESIASGRGFELGGVRAMRVPGYPAFLALTSFVGKYYLWVVIPQALMGVGTVWCAYLAAGDLFGDRCAMAAAAATAVYPYYVVHDTALQETGMFTFLTTAAMMLLLRSMRGGTWMLWCAAGTALGCAVLTRQTLLPFAAGVLVWLACFSEGDQRRRWNRTAMVAIPVVLMVGAWVARNAVLLGSPVMTSELGYQLWNGNNAKTFSHYPAESIDRSAAEAWESMSPRDRAEADALAGDEIAESDWFLRRGIEYIVQHPLQTWNGSLRKLWAAYSWRFSPRRDAAAEWALLLSYGPVSVLGLWGMWSTRKRWKELGPVYLLFLSFTAVTAVFFGHTSHRSYLDVWWMVMGAGVRS